MDISNLEPDIIDRFAYMYAHALERYPIEDAEPSAKLQKKIRKETERLFLRGVSFPQNVMPYIGKSASDSAFLAFMKACHDESQLRKAQRKERFDVASADLSEEVKSALRLLLEWDVHGAAFRRVGTDVQTYVEYGAGYDRILTFENASGVPEGHFDCISYDSLEKQPDGYLLIGQTEVYENDTRTPFSLFFTNVKVEITLLRADTQLFSDTPWSQLQQIAGVILDKCTLHGDYLNDREKALLPLLAELGKLSYWAHIPEAFQGGDFPQLKAYINKYGYRKLLPLVEKLEESFLDEKKKNRRVKKLVSTLNRHQYEPLWREIYSLLVQSQEGYPSRAEAICSPESLQETRREIERLMESHGYAGTYPDFMKKGSIRGLRLEEAYDRTYLVGTEKHAVFHIHCTEECINDHLVVQFLCGTELLRKQETEGDVYSCLFHAKGRKFLHEVSYGLEQIYQETVPAKEDLSLCVRIAAKRAELKRLDKEERKKDRHVHAWCAFLIAVLAMGTFLSVFMTLCMMLFALILSTVIFSIAGMPQNIPLMFTEVPWGNLFVFSWIVFGVVLGASALIEKWKS